MAIFGIKINGPVTYLPAQGPAPGDPLNLGQGYGYSGDFVQVRGPSPTGGSSGGFGGGGSSGGFGGGGSNQTDRQDTYTSESGWAWIPGDPGDPGTPDTVVRNEAGPDWEASARSILSVSGNAVTTFLLSERPNVLIGFADANFDRGARATDIRMGAMVVVEGTGNSVIYPMVNGARLTPAIGTYPPRARMVIYRLGNNFGIQVIGHPEIQYNGPAPTIGDVRVDAMLYSMADVVEDMTLLAIPPENTGPVRGYIGLSAYPRYAEMVKGSARGSIGFRSLVASVVDGLSDARVRGTVGLLGQASGTVGGEASLYGAVGLFAAALNFGDGAELASPHLIMLASEGPYAQVISSLPALRCVAREFEPVVALSGASLLFPGLGIAGRNIQGGVVQASLSLPAMQGVAADGPYCRIFASLPPLNMYADDWAIPNGYIYTEEVVLTWQTFTDPNVYVRIVEELELGASMQFVVLVDGGFYEGLLLQPQVSVEDILLAMIQDGVNLRTATRAPESLVGQYGFDLDTGAATRYDAFGFRGFAYTPQGTYAYREDGLYLLRPGDDDGSVRNAAVDFGDSAFSSLQKSSLEVVFIGMSTDGHVYLKTAADGQKAKTYKVIRSAPTMKVRTGRGITAREWSARLEVIDSTSVELESVEFVVAANGRKWSK